MLYLDRKKPRAALKTQKVVFMVSKDADQRYFPRWDVSNKILYRKENDTVLKGCISRNINCTGACLVTQDEMTPSESLQLTIQLAEDMEPIHVQGRVRWVVKSHAENWVGVQFDEVTDKTTGLIFNYAFEYKKDEILNRWYGNSSKS